MFVKLISYAEYEHDNFTFTCEIKACARLVSNMPYRQSAICWLYLDIIFFIYFKYLNTWHKSYYLYLMLIEF